MKIKRESKKLKIIMKNINYISNIILIFSNHFCDLKENRKLNYFMC